MPSPSNLYAEKVFAEHPTVLWALDDTVDYISLITEADRQASAWTATDCTASTYTNISDEPFSESYVTKIVGSLPSGDTKEISLVSPVLFSTADLQSEMQTFCISTYAYTNSPYMIRTRIGYIYNDGTNDVEVLKDFIVSTAGSWFLMAETFDIPNVVSDVQMVIKFEYLAGGGSTSEYEFYVNGITAGQWSEEFNAVSLGVNAQTIPVEIASFGDLGIEAASYGLVEKPGYYMLDDNGMLKAKNSGIPMVYGARSSTILYPNNDDPSLIIPGQGFLNNAGKYGDFTLEFWARINSNPNSENRIVGPLHSTDGIYANKSFLTIRIGNEVASHYVSEWARPMLIQWRVRENLSTLILNGEEVARLEFSTDALTLPDKYSETSTDQDWIGFYTYDDIHPFEVDCVGIYPYQVPAIVAKRRFVYGQAVESPEAINTAFAGTSVFMDYTFAKYSNNYNYPDMGSFKHGVIENIATDNRMLSSVQYDLPNFSFREIEAGSVLLLDDESTRLDALIADNEPEQDATGFISLVPNSEWDNIASYISFDAASFMSGTTKAFYMIISEGAYEEEQVVFSLYDKASQNYLKAVSTGISIEYVLTYNSEETVIHTMYKEGLDKFAVGFDVQKIINNFGGNVATFFGKFPTLELVIGNTKDYLNQFTGNIHRICFMTPRNSLPIDSAFLVSGFIDEEFDQQDLLDHNTSYKLLPRTYFGKFKLEVDISGYWEDYVPLSSLGKYITDTNGDQQYAIDMIQFNVNYPSPSLKLYQNATFSESEVKTYVSFQYLQSGANSSLGSFTTTYDLPSNGVVSPGNDWLTSKYSVVDGTVIYPPSGVDFRSIALVIHVQMDKKNSLSEKINIKNIQIASQSYNHATPNAIGTKLGNDIYPYKRSGVYFDYKAKNPLTVFKGNTPYLHLTRNSGIELKGTFSAREQRGVSIPVNKNSNDSYKMIAFQASVRYDSETFSTDPIEIFEVQSKNAFIKFFMVATHEDSNRARIYAVDALTGKIENGLLFYWNGNLVKNPYISAKEWGMLGVSFAIRLDFGGQPGAFRVTGPLLFNNISHYELTELQEIQQVSKRPWLKVKYNGLFERDWEYWSEGFIWGDVLILSSKNIYGADPAKIYQSYVGTNKFIIDDDHVFTLGQYSYPIHTEVDSELRVLRPV